MEKCGLPKRRRRELENDKCGHVCITYPYKKTITMCYIVFVDIYLVDVH